MLGTGNDDLFENIPAEDRPDMSRPSPVPEAAVPAAMSGSPDGLGAYMRPYGMSGEIPGLEPRDASPEGAVWSAGITALAAAVTFGTGIALGGPWGGIAGLSFSGGAFNVYRAQKWWGSSNPSEKHEAVVSAIMGTLNVAVGGYTAYRAWQAKAEGEGHRSRRSR